MMDGDVARESSPNDDFDIIGENAECSTSGGGGTVVSVEVDVVANGDDSSISKQPVDEEFSITAMKEEQANPIISFGAEVEEEGQIENSRIENGGDEDKPKASAEDLMHEFGISLDSGVQEELDNEGADQSAGDVVEEDQVAATTSKTEEASVTLDFLAKDQEEEPVPESEDAHKGEIASISLEFDLNSKDESPEEIPVAEPQDIPEDTTKDAPEPEDETPQDSAVDVTLDTSQDTSLDISQDISLDVSLDKPLEIEEDKPQAVEDDTPQKVKDDTPQEVEVDTPQKVEVATPQEVEDKKPQEVEDEKPQQIEEVKEESEPAEPEATPLQQDVDEPAETEPTYELNSGDGSGSEQVPVVTSPTSPKPILARLMSWEQAAKENDGFRPPLSRTKSTRLDSSKFSKFETSSSASAQSSDSDSSSSSKRQSFTGRLNMSRFSQFEQNSDSTDNGSAPRLKRNAGTRSKSLKFSSKTVTSELCVVCQKRVYPMDKISADSVIYHKTCFRCAECKKCLTLGKYAACKGNVFCLPHFKQNFKLKGNYDFTNNPATPRQTNGISDLDDHTDSINIDRSMEGNHLEDAARLVETPISASQNQVVESAPPIRSSDKAEEAMTVEGGTGSVKSRFESGEVSNPTPASSKPIDIYDAPRDQGVSESTPVRREDVVQSSEAADEVKVTAGGIGKFKNMFEKGGVTNLEFGAKKEPVSVGSLSDYESTNQAHVAESTPVYRDDVIRSTDTQEDPGIQMGFSKSLRSRFETETISNIEEKPRQKIDMSSPEEKRVYQAPDRSSRVDIVNAESQSEDPGIKSGQARSLRSLFEKGNVSNVEDKPKATLERKPGALEDFSTQDEGAESTPVRKDDVVSSSSPLDEPMKSSVSARSLKQRWESGEVERAPEQPKPALERTPGSLDNYSMTMVVSENKPQERDDIVKSSSNSDDFLSSKGSATSIKAKWESGEVHNVELRAPKTDNTPKRFSAVYEGDDQTNGVAEHENGVVMEEEEEEEEGEDASWEIKAARAAAMAEADDE